MQALHIGYMKPLNTYYEQEIETWLGSNPSRVVTPFVVCKLFGPAFRSAATMEALVNSFIRTRPFPCNRHIFQDHVFACYRLDESQVKPAGAADNEIARWATSNVSFHNASGGKFIRPADVRSIPHKTPKCSAPIYQAKQSRASCAKLLTASSCRKQLRECQKKPAIKRLFGTKRNQQ